MIKILRNVENVQSLILALGLTDLTLKPWALKLKKKQNN